MKKLKIITIDRTGNVRVVIEINKNINRVIYILRNYKRVALLNIFLYNTRNNKNYLNFNGFTLI